jgi:flagellar motor switch protein FliM
LAEILSQDEINALLAAYGSANSSTESGSPSGGNTPGKEVRLYDFLSPDRFSKEHLRTLSSIHTNFAAGLASTLSGLYQLQTRVSLIGVDQVSYKEYRSSVPTKTMIAEISAEPLSGCMLLEINPSIVGMWVDYLCGGNTQLPASPSELTAIDLSIAKRVLGSILPAYSDAWTSMVSMSPEVSSVWNSESYDEPMVPSEAVLVCSFEISTAEPVGMLTICIPAVGVEAVLPNLASFKLIRGSSKQDRVGAERIRRLMDQVNLPCRVVLGNASVAMSDARNLKVGDIVKTERPIGGQLDLHVGNARLFNCRPGMHGKNMAVVVTSTSTPETQQAKPDAEPISEQIAA